MNWRRTLALGLVGAAGVVTAPAQVNKTWTGSTSTDWFNANNWNPVGVPATNDTVNFTNGTINLTAPVTFHGRFNWGGGMIQGSGLTVATNGVLNIVAGSGTIYLEGSLTNAGAVRWLSGNLTLYNCLGSVGPIVNLPGALWDIECDQGLGANCSSVGPNGFFLNLGTARKLAGTGTTTWFIPFLNSGAVSLLDGSINLNNGGLIDGNFSTTNGTWLHFNGGSFTAGGAPTINGSGVSQFTGGSLFLVSNPIPNLPLVGGSVSLGTNFQGGVITNLTLIGTVLSGNYKVTGTFDCGNGFSGNLLVTNGGRMNWSGGTAAGTLNIASNGVLDLTAGGATVYLYGSLTNAGTVSWLSGNLALYNCLGSVGPIVNLPGALWDIECDQVLGANCSVVGPNGFFQNLGTVRKSQAFGTTTISLPFLNAGITAVRLGILNLNNGGDLAGAFDAQVDRSILLSGGSFTSTAAPMISRPDSVQFLGGSLLLLDDIIPTLVTGGGTVTLGSNFQGGVITNLTLVGSVLSGNYTVSGRFNCGNGFSGNLLVTNGGRMNWSGGTAAGTLNVASNGVLNLTGGGATLYLYGSLTNAGTVSWLSGNLVLYNCLGSVGPLVNLPGALWDIECDQVLGANCSSVGPNGFFQNLGTVRKRSGTGATAWGIPFLNASQVTLQEGTVNLNNGGLIDASFFTTSGTALHFNGGSFTSGSAPIIGGSGASQFTGGNLLLTSDTISNLDLVGGAVSLGTNFQGGSITNLTLLGSVLNGNYAVNGTLNCGNGFSGNLQVADGGAMNWSGGTASGALNVASNGLLNLVAGNGTVYLYGVLTNGGTVSWLSGNLTLANCNASVGPIVNLAGALWDIQCDRGLGANCSSVGPNGFFRNLGTVRKSTGTGVTAWGIPFVNLATVSLLEGTLTLNNGFTPTGGTLQLGLGNNSSFGRLAVAGTAALDGSLRVVLLNGFMPALSNSFALVTYGSRSGVFTNLDLPAAVSWQTNYTANAFSIGVAGVSKLVFLASPRGTNAGSILAPIVVQVEDVNGNPIPTNGVAVSVSLASGSGPLNGTMVRLTDSSGKATFDDLAINVAGSKTLQASTVAGWLSPVASGVFTVSPAAPAKLSLVTEIASPQPAGQSFSPAPKLTVTDRYGNVLSNSTPLITANVASGGGGILGGTNTATVSASTGLAVFNGLHYNLANPGNAEVAVLYFSSPGLLSVTNGEVMMGLVLTEITLRNRNSVVQIDPTTERGLFSWTVEGIEQSYQDWFWLREGSNAPQVSLDLLGTSWGQAYSSSNVVLNYFAQGLSIQLGYTLHGGSAGSRASDLDETINVLNVSNAPVDLHLFSYSDFDLGNIADFDSISLPVVGVIVQQGKGTMMTERVQSPTPNHWQTEFYPGLASALDGSSALTLSDSFNPASSGDQTFAFEWDVPLNVGQSLTLTLTRSIRPSLVPLSIMSAGTNVLVSWPASAGPAFKLTSSAAGPQAGDWTIVTNAPVVVGEEYQVIVSHGSVAQYFRLER